MLDNEDKKFFIICEVISLILAVLYLIGMANLPYGYYQFLRIASLVLLPIFILLSFGSGLFKYFINIITIPSIFLLILFNPIFPIYLDKETWVVLDLISAIVIFVMDIVLLVKFIPKTKSKKKKTHHIVRYERPNLPYPFRDIYEGRGCGTYGANNGYPVEENIIPPKVYKSEFFPFAFEHLNDKDVIDLALFGKTEDEWRSERLTISMKIRDFATTEQLEVLKILEELNLFLKRQGYSSSYRLKELNRTAIRELKILVKKKHKNK